MKSITTYLRETAVSLTDKFVLPGVVGMVNSTHSTNVHLQERLAELELALEDQGWTKVLDNWEKDFSRQGLGEIMRLSRLMWMKNPIINRGVDVQSLYVFGQGMSIHATNPKVNRCLQRFLDYRPNRSVLTSQPAMKTKNDELQIYGNLYICLWPNSSTGDVRLTCIPPDEVKDWTSDPDDSATPLYFLREWTQSVLDVETGEYRQVSGKRYYTALGNTQVRKAIGSTEVQQGCYVLHVKVGCTSDMRWGTPETYISLDWAKAYKEFLEDWCTVNRSLAKWAWKFQTKGGDRGVRDAKAKLSTSISTSTGSSIVERNPAPLVGSTHISTDNIDMTPMKTAGAVTGPEEGRRIFLMAVAGAGLPETFYGDVSVGTLATATSLDRPTELKFKGRQTFWAEHFRTILDYVIDCSATCPNGMLYGLITPLDPVTGVALDPETGDPHTPQSDLDARTDIEDGAEGEDGEDTSRHFETTFPSILEHDISKRVDAMVSAATLKGYTLAGTLDMKTVTAFILKEFGYEDVDELLELLFPTSSYNPQDSILQSQATKQKTTPDPNDPDSDGDPQDKDQDKTDTAPKSKPKPKTNKKATEALLLAEAAGELREVIHGFVSKYRLADTLTAIAGKGGE